MDLEEDGEAVFVGAAQAGGEGGVIEAFGDEEDGVGAQGAGLGDLIGVDDEVFAEDGEGCVWFDRGDEGWVAREVFFVCEARNGRCAAHVVSSRDG